MGACSRTRTWKLFGGVNTTNAIYFKFDPDGRQTDNTTNGPGKAVVVMMQYNGTMQTWGTLTTTVQSSTSSYSPTPANDPFGLQVFKASAPTKQNPNSN